MTVNVAAVDMLRKIRSRIESPDKWSNYLSDDTSKKMCVLQAMWEQSELFGPTVCETVYQTLNKESRGGCDVGGFNDSHTHAEVLDLLDRTIQKLTA